MEVFSDISDEDSEIINELSVTKFLYFGSNVSAPFHKLSNFHAAPVTILEEDLGFGFDQVNPNFRSWIRAKKGHAVFPSIEHAWHALKATNQSTFAKFLVGGAFARWDTEAFAQFSKPDSNDPEKHIEKAKKQFKYWSAKQNVGIIAKLAANPKYLKTLGIKAISMNYSHERLAWHLEEDIWLTLLRLKYIQNEECRKVLIGVFKIDPKNILAAFNEPKQLVEFDRSAGRVGTQCYWGGCIKDNAVVGLNTMGKYLTRVGLTLTRLELEAETERKVAKLIADIEEDDGQVSAYLRA